MGERSPMDRPPIDQEEVEGIKAGYAKDFFAQQAANYKDMPADDNSERTEHERKADIFTCISDFMIGNPHVDAIVLYRIDAMINDFVNPDKSDRNMGGEEQLAMQIATYLNSRTPKG